MGYADSKAGAGAKLKIKVEYFGFAHNRVDPIRFLLHHAKVDYEYVGYEQAQWGAIKGTPAAGEFGGLPKVTYAGKEYGQSMATLRMLGAKLGYYDPKDWKMAAKIDQILDAWVDMLEKVNGVNFSNASQEEKSKLVDERIKLAHEPALRVMEEMLAEGPYLAGAKVTIADCAIVATLAN